MTRQKNNKAVNNECQKAATEKQNAGQKEGKTKRRQVIEIKPSNVRYSQCSIANTFSDGGKITDLLEDIRNGRCFVSAIPTISVIRKNGKWYSADNRRLWVFKELQRSGHLRTIKVKVSKRMFSGKMTTKNDGISIEIRKGSKTDNDNEVMKVTNSPMSDWRSGNETDDYTESESGDFEESSDEEDDLVGSRDIATPSTCFQPHSKPTSYYENHYFESLEARCPRRQVEETKPVKPTVSMAGISSSRATDEVKPIFISKPKTTFTNSSYNQQDRIDLFEDLLKSGTDVKKIVDLYKNRHAVETKPARQTVDVSERSHFRAAEESRPRISQNVLYDYADHTRSVSGIDKPVYQYNKRQIGETKPARLSSGAYLEELRLKSSSRPTTSYSNTSYGRRNLFDDFDSLSRADTDMYRHGRDIYSPNSLSSGHSSFYETVTSRSPEPYQKSRIQNSFSENNATPSHQRVSHSAPKSNKKSDDSLCTIL